MPMSSLGLYISLHTGLEAQHHVITGCIISPASAHGDSSLAVAVAATHPSLTCGSKPLGTTAWN